MNILQMEDMVKGLPDDRIKQELQQPSGQMPEFLLLSEIQRRGDMRKRYANEQQQPKPTIKDQILSQGLQPQPPQQLQPQQPMAGQGIASLPQQPMPPQPPAQQMMMSGGLVRMNGQQGSGQVPLGKQIINGRVYITNPDGTLTPENINQIEIDVQRPSFFDNMGSDIGNSTVAYEGVTNEVAPIRSPFAHKASEREVATNPITYDRAVLAGQPDYTDPSYGEILSDFGGSVRDTMTYRPDPELQSEASGEYAQFFKDMGNKGIASLKAGFAAAKYPEEKQDKWFRVNTSTPHRWTLERNIQDPADPEFDYSKDHGGLADIWDSVSGAVKSWTGFGDEKPNPVDPEKAAQMANARGAAVSDNSKTQGGDTPDVGNPELDAISGLEALMAEKAGAESEARKLLQTARFNVDDLVAEAKADSMDVSELTKQAQKQAWAAALMELGAGIAGGDMSKGLSDASRVMQQGYGDARKYELLGQESQRKANQAGRELTLAGRSAEFEKQKELAELANRENDARLNRILTKYGLDNQKAQQVSWAYKNSNEANKNNIDVLTKIISELEIKLSPMNMNAKDITPQQRAEMEQQRKLAFERLMSLGGLDLNAPENGMAAGGSVARSFSELED